MEKTYLVVSDTFSHDQIGELVTILKNEDKDGHLRCKVIKTGRIFYCKRDDLKDVTIDLWFKKTGHTLYFFTGACSFLAMIGNIYNDGQWYGTAVWAFISFAMFTIYRIKED